LEIGLLVNDILVEHFPQIVDTGFTAAIEEDFDKIAEGKKEWVPMIREFYKPFHKNIESKVRRSKKKTIRKTGKTLPAMRWGSGGEIRPVRKIYRLQKFSGVPLHGKDGRRTKDGRRKCRRGL